MNKKLLVVAALIFGAAGLFLAQGTVKAQDAAATDNSAMANSDAVAMNADAPAMNADAPAMNADAAAPANAAQ